MEKNGPKRKYYKSDEEYKFDIPYKEFIKGAIKRAMEKEQNKVKSTKTTADDILEGLKRFQEEIEGR